MPPSATPAPPERALATAELELWYKLDRSFKVRTTYLRVCRLDGGKGAKKTGLGEY